MGLVGDRIRCPSCRGRLSPLLVGTPFGQPDLIAEDENDDSDDFDRDSKMSFSYEGMDNITIQASAAKNRGVTAAKATIARRGGSTTRLRDMSSLVPVAL